MILNTIYLLWSGIIIGVSFIATIVKFHAKGITIPIALSIGKVTFNLQIIIDLIILSIIALLFVYYYSQKLKITAIHIILFTILLCIIIIQKFYMLPILDARVDMRNNGKELKDTWHHYGYVIMETSKVIITLIAGLIKIKT